MTDQNPTESLQQHKDNNYDFPTPEQLSNLEKQINHIGNILSGEPKNVLQNLDTKYIEQLQKIWPLFPRFVRAYNNIGKLIQRIEESNIDFLTGLYKRKRLYKELNQLKTPTEVAYIDLTKFKKINDQISHEQGDATLKEFAKTLQDTLTEYGGKIFRIGGDEFVVTYPQPQQTSNQPSLTALLDQASEKWDAKRSNWIFPTREGEDFNNQDYQNRTTRHRQIMAQNGGMIYGTYQISPESRWTADKIVKYAEKIQSEQKEKQREQQEDVFVEFIKMLQLTEDEKKLMSDKIFTEENKKQLLDDICRYHCKG